MFDGPLRQRIFLAENAREAMYDFDEKKDEFLLQLKKLGISSTTKMEDIYPKPCSVDVPCAPFGEWAISNFQYDKYVYDLIGYYCVGPL